MKILKQIASLIFVVIFLISSAGVVIFESHCSCSGNQEVSLFVSPETCENNFHKHHQHSDGEMEIEIETEKYDCHDCTDHVDDCGCSAPLIKYIKLKNELLNEEVKFVKVQPLNVYVACILLDSQFSIHEETSQKVFYIDPPPIFQSSQDLLIKIQQLKIPTLT